MLETIREFALDQLVSSGEEPALRRRHASWYLALAERVEPELWGPDQVRSLSRLEREHDNLRAALAWLDRSRDAAGLLRLAGALAWFWYVRGHMSEGKDWLHRALDSAQGVSGQDHARARALLGAARIAHYLGDDDHATAMLRQSLALWQSLDDHRGAATCFLLLGVVAEDAGRYDDAENALQQAHALFDDAGERIDVARTLLHQGIVAWGKGALPQAAMLCHEAVALHRDAGDAWGTLMSLIPLGHITCERGNLRGAATLYRECLTLGPEVGTSGDLAGCLGGIALVAVAGDQLEPAVRLFGAAETLRQVVGEPLRLPERARYERATSIARERLDAEAFETAWTAGRAYSLERAAAEAATILAAAEIAPVAAGLADPTAGLSSREIEILRLIAAGNSNQEIADTLFISRRTVSTHTTNLYRKLSVASRTAAVAAAYTLGVL